MKYMLWTVMLAAMFVLSAAPAAAAEDDKDIPTTEQMEQRGRVLEFEGREAEFEHQQKMRDVEIDERRAKIELMRRGPGDRHHNGGCGLVVLVIILTNILLTVWVCKDMREQKIGRALWVPITLLAGVFGAIVYAIVRNADIRQGPGK